jgi:AraC-like DNA-binding protein
MEPGDILMVGMGDVHYFLPRPLKSKRIIVQFDLSMVEHVSDSFQDRRFKTPLIKNACMCNQAKQGQAEDGKALNGQVHRLLEEQILTLDQEYRQKAEGYKLAVMARLYDLVSIFLRHLPLEKVSPLEKNQHRKKLDRLDQVLKFVEENYAQPLSLKEVAEVANFSVYHFTRFFKDTTGMTFLQYLNSYRISRAVKDLGKSEDSITEVAFRSGFGSIKTFNRVFKQLKGCSPTEYKKKISS